MVHLQNPVSTFSVKVCFLILWVKTLTTRQQVATKGVAFHNFYGGHNSTRMKTLQGLCKLLIDNSSSNHMQLLSHCLITTGLAWLRLINDCFWLTSNSQLTYISVGHSITCRPLLIRALPWKGVRYLPAARYIYNLHHQNLFNKRITSY